jgi:hypothetical protein
MGIDGRGPIVGHHPKPPGSRSSCRAGGSLEMSKNRNNRKPAGRPANSSSAGEKRDRQARDFVPHDAAWIFAAAQVRQGDIDERNPDEAEPDDDAAGGRPAIWPTSQATATPTSDPNVPGALGPNRCRSRRRARRPSVQAAFLGCFQALFERRTRNRAVCESPQARKAMATLPQ